MKFSIWNIARVVIFINWDLQENYKRLQKMERTLEDQVYWSFYFL